MPSSNGRPTFWGKMRTIYPSPHRANRFTGFTIIELLTVVAIIGILIAILIPTVGNLREGARITRATSDAKQIVIAWRTYYNDRHQWPEPQDFETGDAQAKSSERADGEVFWGAYVQLLTGNFDPETQPSWAKHNPGATDYLSLAPEQIDANGEFVDPWDNPYKFKLDKRYTETAGVITDGTRRGDLRIGRFDYSYYGDPNNPSDQQIIVEDLAIAWSRGPDTLDHDPQVAEDDPKSW